ncbi:MAG: hypothetical protein WCO63_03335 [Bacteroidota bacterium]
MKFKTGLYVFALMMVTGLLFFSCKKDKTDDTKKNQVTYNGTNHSLDKGIIVHFAWKTEGYLTVLVLVSPEGVIHTTGTQFDSISGTNGSGITIGLFSSDSAHLAEGIYPYDTTGNMTAGTFNGASLALNFHFGTPDGMMVPGLGGAVIVKKIGTDYEISYSGVDKTGKVIDLYYKGVLKDYLMAKSTWKAWGL